VIPAPISPLHSAAATTDSFSSTGSIDRARRARRSADYAARKASGGVTLHVPVSPASAISHAVTGTGDLVLDTGIDIHKVLRLKAGTYQKHFNFSKV
jgi:hypothetical protein